MNIPFEIIDRVQDIISIPIALYICYMLFRIRQEQQINIQKKIWEALNK